MQFLLSFCPFPFSVSHFYDSQQRLWKAQLCTDVNESVNQRGSRRVVLAKSNVVSPSRKGWTGDAQPRVPEMQNAPKQRLSVE